VNRRALALAAAVVAAAPGIAAAHTMSDGHLELVTDGARLVGTLDVAARDLHDAFGLDPGGDGAITWADVTAGKAAIGKYVVDHLAIKSADGPCPITTGELGEIERPDGSHVAIAVTATCAAPATTVTVDYRMLYELDAQHRGLLHVGDGRAIAKNGDGPITLAARSGLLPRLAAAIPAGAIVLPLAAALLVLVLAIAILRRTTRRPLLPVIAIAAVVSAPVWWSLHHLVS
jgi:hypothetical protein